jgi:hypothetical protein
VAQAGPSGRTSGGARAHRRSSSWDADRDEAAELHAFSRDAAVLGPDEAAARALQERRARTGGLAQLRAALAPHAASPAVKATSRVAAPPKAKHVHTLVLESWHMRNDASFFARVYSELARRPVLASPVVAVKVLLVFHKLMQQGSPETLPAAAALGAHIVEGLRIAWTPERLREHPGEFADVAALIHPYATLIKVKVEFHERFRAFDNNYAAAGNAPAAGGDAEVTQQAACELLFVLDEALRTLRRALRSLASVRARDGARSLPAAVATALLREAHLSYDALLFLMALLAPHGMPPPEMREFFARSHGTLREACDDAGAYPALQHLDTPPRLSAEPPQFWAPAAAPRRGQGVPLLPTPPSSAAAPTPVAHWPEDEDEDEDEEAFPPGQGLKPAEPAQLEQFARGRREAAAVAPLPRPQPQPHAQPYQQHQPPPPPPRPRTQLQRGPAVAPPAPPSLLDQDLELFSAATPPGRVPPGGDPFAAFPLGPQQPPPLPQRSPAPPPPPPQAAPLAPHLASYAPLVPPVAPSIAGPGAAAAAAQAAAGNAAAHEWAIPLEEVKLGVVIGRGAFGEVLRAVYEGTDVAVKRMSSVTQQAQSDFTREVSLLTKLRHPHVVLFMGAAVTPNELYIVMEYAGNGSLWGVLHSRKRDAATPARRLQWAAETAKGLSYLHSRSPPIVHRDLKSGNLLLCEDWHIKVSDFGLARTKSADGARTLVGTYAWMAPEVLEQRPYDERADVYSFAIVLWELLTLQEPFKGLEPMQVMRACDRGERPPLPPEPRACPPAYCALMARCWAREPEKRPTFREALAELQTMQVQR